MEFNHLLPLSVALFCLALLGSHVQASLPAEDYWQTLWPDTPMPKAFKDLLVQPPADWITRRSATLVKQQQAAKQKYQVDSFSWTFMMTITKKSKLQQLKPYFVTVKRVTTELIKLGYIFMVRRVKTELIKPSQ
ncbi:hypothetical protein PIB30_003490 [Stylosanthes scabra]|uniref:Uncharacterized protein n=1 Tax=Stylosanthes scabra TaxID=79078 RepID=A0ABU6V594_9FABA|nr:hypothetical protein [Stylosanthes scabra]